MEVSHSVSLQADVEKVWQFLLDVPRVARCIPGVEGVREVEAQSRYQATLADRVGPFKVKFALGIDARFDAAAHRIDLKVKGQDPLVKSVVEVNMGVTALPAEGGSARLEITGEADILGKLGTLGQPVVRRKIADVMQEFGARVQRELGENGGQSHHAS